MFYFGVKARGQLPALIADVGGLNFNWISDLDWPGMKDKTPFGQLPYLEDGDVKMGQSMAIARYLAKKAGLQGDNDKDFAMSEQLIEESNDIYTVLARAKYSPDDKTEAWNNALQVTIPQHFAQLENLLHGDYFGSKLLVGDLAVYSIINIILDLDSHVLDKTPRLKAFYERMNGDSRLAKFKNRNIPLYFTRE